ncbi:hypothetical protein P3X46_011712 [Hevea brasiliensis]|uniref:BHLH domain-containing protein n=1 Tax=Hevea brasiliensis TaxID=3981 RepID=A0ABQ9MBN8_HEVBR|nr:transcription factor bHLH167-like [Hevea brasiliensis]KAJ9176395.1 hypothetical protein P3X46_011712 [Hevea brasiliensis]
MAPKNSSSRLQRNMKERIRRMRMKHLLAKLAPLVHPDPSKLSGPEVLDQATSHVKQLQGRIEELMNRRKEMQPTMKSSSARIPALNIRTRDTILEVNLITGLQKNFMLHEIINVLQEEGADIINFAYRSTCDSVLYSIRAQAISVRIGMEIPTIEERLKEVIY